MSSHQKRRFVRFEISNQVFESVVQEFLVRLLHRDYWLFVSEPRAVVAFQVFALFVDRASGTWWGAAPTVLKASQEACFQIARVNAKDMKPTTVDAREIGASGAIV
jgi:hypothetical protein